MRLYKNEHMHSVDVPTSSAVNVIQISLRMKERLYDLLSKQLDLPPNNILRHLAHVLYANAIK